MKTLLIALSASIISLSSMAHTTEEIFQAAVYEIEMYYRNPGDYFIESIREFRQVETNSADEIAVSAMVTIAFASSDKIVKEKCFVTLDSNSLRPKDIECRE